LRAHPVGVVMIAPFDIVRIHEIGELDGRSHL
jgi:hypothetical protein